MLEHPFLKYNQDFVTFGTQHLVVIGIMVLLSLFLSILGKRKIFSEVTQLAISRGMAISIAFWAIAYLVILMALGKFNYKTDLPIDLCNMTAILLPFLMWRPNVRVFRILYFLILGGTMQAVLTPHLYNGFPNFIFIKYWWVHAGLVVYAIYHTIAFDMKPTFRSIFHAFFFLNAYVLLAFFINLALGSNYVYVMHKPPTASPLDYLGPWPYYIMAAELIGLLVFTVLYLPIGITQWLRKQSVQEAATREESAKTKGLHF